MVLPALLLLGPFGFLPAVLALGQWPLRPKFGGPRLLEVKLASLEALATPAP